MSALPPFNYFPHLLGEWLKGQGPESDIVVSTRVRLARNLRDVPFSVKSTPQQREEVLALATAALERVHLEKSTVTLKLTGMNEVCRDVLVERHLISRELANGDGPRAVVFGRGEMLSVMVNEEDHLRLQWIKSGFDVDRAWGALVKVDKALERELPYAFSEKYGYLTACPTNVGTGMRVSVMVHLPALTLKEHVQKVFKAAEKMNHAVRGLYGEGTRAFGDFYQISNQATLGRTEEEIIQSVKAIVPKILEYERRMRGTIFTEERSLLEDRVFRALATLRSARRLNVQEMMSHLSMLRLGVDLGLVTDITARTLNELFLIGQPSHLQREEGREMTPGERDERRAALVRTRLAVTRN
ncbi:MAG: protein arginine kinase [Planctomycetes bacterium]|nr:protein arginine kinase [Planctomycetota bacterium]